MPLGAFILSFLIASVIQMTLTKPIADVHHHDIDAFDSEKCLFTLHGHHFNISEVCVTSGEICSTVSKDSRSSHRPLSAGESASLEMMSETFCDVMRGLLDDLEKHASSLDHETANNIQEGEHHDGATDQQIVRMEHFLSDITDGVGSMLVMLEDYSNVLKILMDPSHHKVTQFQKDTPYIRSLKSSMAETKLKIKKVLAFLQGHATIIPGLFQSHTTEVEEHHFSTPSMTTPRLGNKRKSRDTTYRRDSSDAKQRSGTLSQKWQYDRDTSRNDNDKHQTGSHQAGCQSTNQKWQVPRGTSRNDNDKHQTGSHEAGCQSTANHLYPTQDVDNDNATDSATDSDIYRQHQIGTAHHYHESALGHDIDMSGQEHHHSDPEHRQHDSNNHIGSSHELYESTSGDYPQHDYHRSNHPSGDHQNVYHHDNGNHRDDYHHREDNNRHLGLNHYNDANHYDTYHHENQHENYDSHNNHYSSDHRDNHSNYPRDIYNNYQHMKQNEDDGYHSHDHDIHHTEDYYRRAHPYDDYSKDNYRRNSHLQSDDHDYYHENHYDSRHQPSSHAKDSHQPSGSRHDSHYQSETDDHYDYHGKPSYHSRDEYYGVHRKSGSLHTDDHYGSHEISDVKDRNGDNGHQPCTSHDYHRNHPSPTHTQEYSSQNSHEDDVPTHQSSSYWHANTGSNSMEDSSTERNYNTGNDHYGNPSHEQTGSSHGRTLLQVTSRDHNHGKIHHGDYHQDHHGDYAQDHYGDYHEDRREDYHQDHQRNYHNDHHDDYHQEHHGYNQEDHHGDYHQDNNQQDHHEFYNQDHQGDYHRDHYGDNQPNHYRDNHQELIEDYHPGHLGDYQDHSLDHHQGEYHQEYDSHYYPDTHQEQPWKQYHGSHDEHSHENNMELHQGHHTERHLHDPSHQHDSLHHQGVPEHGSQTDMFDLPFAGRDCGNMKGLVEGVYTILPDGAEDPVAVYCIPDHDDHVDHAAWTVFQKRSNGGTDFDQDWETYKKGFGNPSGEFWLGNDFLSLLTVQGQYGLRIDLEDWTGTWTVAKYKLFRVFDEDMDYIIFVSDYDSNSTIADSLSNHSMTAFSTTDRDNDLDPLTNCAHVHHGGWWYHSCFDSNLNGPYHQSENGSGDHENVDGVLWLPRGHHGYKTTMMSVRKSDWGDDVKYADIHEK